jgi:hypothetical protein
MSPPSKTSYFEHEFLIRTTNNELFPIEIKLLAIALVSKYQNQNFFKLAAPSQRLLKTYYCVKCLNTLYLLNYIF